MELTCCNCRKLFNQESSSKKFYYLASENWINTSRQTNGNLTTTTRVLLSRLLANSEVNICPDCLNELRAREKKFISKIRLKGILWLLSAFFIALWGWGLMNQSNPGLGKVIGFIMAVTGGFLLLKHFPEVITVAAREERLQISYHFFQNYNKLRQPERPVSFAVYTDLQKYIEVVKESQKEGFFKKYEDDFKFSYDPFFAEKISTSE